jgi:hypothetical protein
MQYYRTKGRPCHKYHLSVYQSHEPTTSLACSYHKDLGVASEVYRVSLMSACSLSTAKWWTQRSARRQGTTKQRKIKPPVCLIKHPQSTVGCGGTAPSFNQTMDGGEWSALRPSHICPRERASGIQWIVCGMGPRAGLDALDTNILLLSESELWFPGRLVRSPLTIPTQSPPPSGAATQRRSRHPHSWDF